MPEEQTFEQLTEGWTQAQYAAYLMGCQHMHTAAHTSLHTLAALPGASPQVIESTVCLLLGQTMKDLHHEVGLMIKRKT